jgi:hypothetical protein
MERALPEPYRAAIYYAPDRDDPLWQAGCAWLGRDPETDETLPQPGILAQLTTSPRQYGFHATLKPPIHLAHGLAAFLDDTQKLAATLQPFKMPRLEVKQLGAFIALCLSGPSPEFRSLADHCVTELDRHRIPEDQSTQAARAANRSPRQRGNIERFGYPLLFDDWHFHMTLTNPTEDPTLHDQAQTWFDPVLSHPRTCTAICIYQQPTRTAPFTLTHRIRLGA